MKKISKKLKKRICIAVIAIAVIAVAYYMIFIKPKLNTEEIVYKENTAQYGLLQSGVTESGSVEFGLVTQLYDLDISTDDDEDDDDDDEDDEEEHYLKIEEVYVAVGQRIEKGDAIYKFTQSSIDDVRKTLTYAQTQAQISLNNAQTEYDVGVTEAGLSYNETMLDTSLAQSTYNNTVARLYNDMAAKSLQIQQLLADIYKQQQALVDEDYLEEKSDLKESYEDAVDALEDVSEDFVTNRVEATQNFRQAREKYESFMNQFDESNESIESMVQQVYDIQEEILYDQQLLEKELLSAQQDYDMSNVSGSIADTKYSSSLTSYETALNKAKEELEEATEKLDAFNEFVGDGTVYAEDAGLVTEVGYEEDDYLVMAGVLISYATSDAMTISVDVSQEDVVTMQVGDSVDISFAAYEDESYKGIIKSITTTSTSRSSATVSYPVVISIQGDTSKLYSGMTADVTFVTDESKEVVYVSRKAIVEENGKQYVYKKSGNNYVLSPVETGFTNGANIEIVSGLEEGESYYIASVAVKETEEKESGKEDEDEQSETGADMQMPQDGDGQGMPQGGNGQGMPSGGNGQNMPQGNGGGRP
jgi:HlyD family secretion protein